MKNTVTIVLLAVAALFVGVNSWLHVWTGDDAVYCYVVGPDRDWNEDAAAMRPVASAADVLESQYHHYFLANGRFPVHVLVQAFAGPLGRTAFAVANALVFVLAVWLLCRLELPRGRRGPLLYAANVVAMLMLFPETNGSRTALWLSISLSLNYLWVMAAVAAFLLLWRRSRAGGAPLPAAVCVLAGLAAGWSNEAFAVPVGAALLLSVAARRFRFAGRSEALLCVSMWVSTLPLVLSPGTLGRAVRADDVVSVAEFAYRTALCYSSLTLVYVLAAGMLAALLWRRRACVDFVRANRFMFLLLGIDLVFTLYAHSNAHSMCQLEFIALILIVRACARMWPGAFAGRRQSAAAAVVAAVMAVVLGGVTAVNMRSFAEFRRMSARLAASPDACTYIEDVEQPALLRPLTAKNPSYLLPDNYSATAMMLRYGGGRSDRRPLILSPDDYALLRAGSADSARLLPGTARALFGREFCIVPLDSASAHAPRIVLGYARRELSRRPLLMRPLLALKPGGPYSREAAGPTVEVFGRRYMLVLNPTPDVPVRADLAL